MRFFNWAESFKENPTCEDVLEKVQRTEKLYWIFFSLSLFTDSTVIAKARRYTCSYTSI